VRQERPFLDHTGIVPSRLAGLRGLPEGALDVPEHLVAIEVAGNHENHVVRHVHTFVEDKDVVTRNLPHLIFVADGRIMHGMLVENGVVQCLVDDAPRLFPTLFQFLDDDPHFSIKLVLRERAVDHPVGQKIDGVVYHMRRGRDVITCVGFGGVGVVGAPEPINQVVDLRFTTGCSRAAVDQVLEEVGDSRSEIFLLVHTAGPDVDAHGGDRGIVILVDNDLHAIGQDLQFLGVDPHDGHTQQHAGNT